MATARDPAKFSLSAHAEERFFAPLRRRSFRARSGFTILVGVVLLIHAAVLGYLLYRDTTEPFPAFVETETPVEIVVEPPPPPPPPQQPEPPQQKPPPPPPKPPAEMEKPATSAPRVSKEPSKAKAADDKTAARKRAEPREGQPEPAKDSAAPEQPPTPEQKESAAKLEDDKREAEALDKATPDPAKTPDKEQPKAKPKPPDKPADAVRQLSDLSDKPDDTVSNAGKMQPFPEGNEDNRYLAVVYGMVMSKNRYPGSSAERRHAAGVVSVVFVVDPFGHVRNQEVVKSSGQADLDALAMGAVRSAGPFPPPPGSGPQQLVATMTFGGRSSP